VNMLDDSVTKVWDSFWSRYYYHTPKIDHFLSYVIMACQWINFRHQTKQVHIVSHANSLGNENPITNKTFDCCISTCRNSYYVSFVCESICPSMPFCPTMFVGSVLTWAPWRFNFLLAWVFYWSFLARMMASSNAMHPPCPRFRDWGEMHHHKLWHCPPLEFPKLVSCLSCVEGCFLWNIWWICCWHTM
jgi:hypothetical protein